MFSTKRITYVLILCLSICTLVYGQGFTAAVVGAVTDSSGGAVAAATVTVTNSATGLKQTTQTNTSGQYTVPQLQPGSYTVSVEAKGFKTGSAGPTQLQVDQQLKLDFTLQVGAVSENVTVTAEGEQLQTENATVGTAVTSQQTTELPLNGRNFFQLNLLVPGSAPSVQGSNLSGEGGSFEVHGLRETSNYFWIDGVDNTTQAIGEVVINPPEYSIQEFRVMSPTYDAQFGRTAGAQVNIITKSGGNDYHGDVYLFIRNSVFDAKNFFDPAGTIPAYRRGQYGGDLGGKIKKDRAFFYGAFEGLTYAQGESNSNIVPSAQQTKGNFSDSSTIIRNPLSCTTPGTLSTCTPFSGNIIPTSLLDPTGLKIASFYPAPNAPGNRLNVSPTGHNTDNVAVAKGDIVLTQNNRLSLRSAFEDNTYVYPIAVYSPSTAIPGFGLNQPGAHNYTEGVTDTWLLSPTLIGVFATGWNRFEFEYFGQTSYSQSGGIDWCTQLGILGCRPSQRDWAWPSVNLNGTYSNLGGSTTQFGPFDTFFVNPSMTWVKGKHTLKFGFDYHRFTSDYEIGWGSGGSFTYRGTFSGNPLSDLLLGYPFSVTKTVYQNNDSQFLFVAPEYSGFIQDEYHLTPHLTITAGLRYEYPEPATEQRNHISNLDLATQQVIIAGQNGRGSNVYTTSAYEFQPRIGVAWSPRGSSKWAVRGGYGIFNELTEINQVLSLFNNPPFQNSYTFIQPSAPTVTTANALNAATASNLPSFTVWQNGYKMGRVQQYSVEVQRQLASNLVVDVAYVGTKGDDLYGTVNLNQPVPGPGTVQPRRAYTQYTNVNLACPCFYSRYNGLEIRGEKRMSNGLQFLASYTWSSAKDDSSGSGTGVQDPRNLAGSYGPSSYDIPQHFSLSYVYELPFGSGRKFASNLHGVTQAVLGGWQTNGIWTLHSGQPVTPVLAQDNLNVQGSGERPNKVGDPSTSSAGCQVNTPNCWWNYTAYAYPAQYTFGTAGRNSLRGPDFDEFDMSLVKNFRFNETRRLEFRAEAFNLFNRVNFNNPGATLVQPTAGPGNSVTGQGSFGVVTSAQQSRQIQFGMRFLF